MNATQTTQTTEYSADATAERDAMLHALFGDDAQRAELELVAGELGDEVAPSGYHPIFYTVLFRC